MPQFSVTQNAITAQPGMLFDGQRAGQDIVSAVAAVNILPGTYCEFLGGATGTQRTVQPLQDANLSGTVTVTNASASITFSTAQTLAQGQGLVFSDQPGVVYYLAAAVSNTTSGTLTVTYSGTGGGGKLTRLAPYLPQVAGIAMYNALGFENSYVPWSLQTTLSGTCTVTNGNTSVTFSANQTLAAGTQLVFSSQPGVVYFVATATSSSTSATLTVKYGGTSNGAATITIPPGGSSAKGWLAGQPIPLLRRGRIWGLSDGGGSQIQTGAINVWHSSTGSNPQGVFTFSATAMTAGAEIDVAPYCEAFNPGVAFTPVTQTDPFGNTFFVTPVSINVT